MKKVSTWHRMFQGILTGVFMFAGYFLIDMYVAFINPEFYEVTFKSNQLYFIMFGFAVGILVSIIYLKIYKRQVIRRGSNVE